MNKIIIWFGHFVKFMDNGRNQLFGRLYGVVQLVLTVAIYFGINGKQIGLMDIFIYSIILTIIMVIAGYFYSTKGFLASEISSRNKESPETMEALYNTRKILVELQEMKK